MRSMLKLSKPAARAMSAARIASSPLCIRPRAWSLAGWKLCTPMDKRLMPVCRYALNFSCSKVPGLASRVISMSTANGMRCSTPRSKRPKALALNRLGVPPPKKIELMGRPGPQPSPDPVGQQRIDVRLFRQIRPGSVRIEVAIRAFAHAPGNMDIQGQRWECGETCRAAMAQLGGQRFGHARPRR